MGTSTLRIRDTNGVASVTVRNGVEYKVSTASTRKGFLKNNIASMEKFRRPKKVSRARAGPRAGGTVPSVSVASDWSPMPTFESRLPTPENHPNLKALKACIVRYESSHFDRVLYICQTLMHNSSLDQDPEFSKIVRRALTMLQVLRYEDPHVAEYHNHMAAMFDFPDRI